MLGLVRRIVKFKNTKLYHSNLQKELTTVALKPL